MELVINLIIVTVLGHVKRYRSTLFFDHGKMFDVLVSVEEKLPSVKFNQYTGHRPDITLLVPDLILENHLGSSVLSGIDNEGMSFMWVSGSTEINELYLSWNWSMPLANTILITWVLARKIAWVINVTTSLRTIDAPLILYLLKITLNASEVNLRLGITFRQ